MEEASRSPHYPTTRSHGKTHSTKAPRPPTWLVICGAISVQIGFGFYPVMVRKFGTEQKVNPYIFTFYRDACAFPVLMTYSLVMEQKLAIPNLKMVPQFMLMGLFGMFIAQLMYITGVYTVGADTASVFQPLVPVWTTILGIVTCTEPVGSLRMLHTWAKFLGVALAAGGAIEITLTGTSSENGDHNGMESPTALLNSTSQPVVSVSPLNWSEALLGYMALAIQTPMTAVYVLLQKRFIFNNPNSKWKNYPVATTSICYFFGAVYMGLASTYFVLTGQTGEFRIPQSSCIALVYAVFITSALCYGLITWTNKHLSSSIATAFWPVQVLVTVLASFIVIGEQLSLWQYVGAVMLICGLMCVIYSNRMDEKAASAIRLDNCNWSSHNGITTAGRAESLPLLHTTHNQHGHSATNDTTCIASD